MSSPTVLDLTNSHAAIHGLPAEQIVQLAKAIRVLARKLDRDTGTATKNYEAQVDAVLVSDDPTVLVP